jgi:TRAP-type C4-dicarboxylate transport system permease small subunit
LLAGAISLVNFILAFFDQADLGIYFLFDLIVFLVLTLLYVYLSPQARQALNKVAVVYFVVFIIVVAFRSIEIFIG